MNIKPTAPGPTDNEWVAAFNIDRLQFMIDAQRQWGNIVRFPVSARRALWLINEPDAIEEVQVRSPQHYGRGIVFKRRAGKFLGKGLLTSEGEENAANRRLILPTFHRSRLAAYSEIMIHEAGATLDRWQSDQVIEATEAMTEFTMQVVVHCLFGTDEIVDVPAITHAITAAIAYLNDDTVPLSSSQIDLLRDLATDLIEKRRITPGGDLVSMLLAARFEDGSALTTQQIVDEVLTLFVAGHETSANALSWTIYLLSSRPEVRERLRQEVRGATAQTIATTDYPYLNLVLQESLRMYGVAWNLTREVLQNVRLGEYDVPKGDTLLISPFIAHRTEAFWPNGDSFDPERFLGSSYDRRMYFPFSIGPRYCVGRPFAMLEMKIMLALMMQRFDILRTLNTPQPEPYIVVRPRGGVQIQVAPRA